MKWAEKQGNDENIGPNLAKLKSLKWLAAPKHNKKNGQNPCGLISCP